MVLNISFLKKGWSLAFASPDEASFVDASFSNEVVKKFSYGSKEIYLALVYNVDFSRLELLSEASILEPGTTLIYSKESKEGETFLSDDGAFFNEEIQKLTNPDKALKLLFFDISEEKIMSIKLTGEALIKIDLNKYENDGVYEFSFSDHAFRLQKNDFRVQITIDDSLELSFDDYLDEVS